ncbi:ABC transporter permease [Prosthecomicrobium hirschii]|uniref:ABC transporter permease n=1 Tax=Prosthecodimorpha hirschii TaxID=665126 RepID=UPI00112DBBD4|nr:ABC transporter permease [Prosthecomicrobium hirschii]TPQ49102.1 ABC transporter permease [Prosthecomicrobium hirschii]
MSANETPPRAPADFEKVAIGAQATVATFKEETPSLLKRIQHLLHVHPTAIPALVLVLSVAVFAMAGGQRFLTAFNLSVVLQQVTIIAVIGIAQTIVVLTAGIDLSVGAIAVLASMVMGKLAVTAGVPTPIAILIGVAVGAACGAVNGILVTRFRLPPFIVTLGTWYMVFALNLWYSDSETIRSQDIGETAPLLQFFATAIPIGDARLTYGSIAMVIAIALFWYLLSMTAWGRHVHAVGDDPEAARLAGIRVERVLMSVYIVAGIVCAFAAWMMISRYGSASPQSGQTSNLDSITAVVIGGTSLFGGRGSIVGTLLGALIVGVFRNGLALSGVNVLWQDFAVGALIIVAVALDQWLRRVSQ